MESYESCAVLIMETEGLVVSEAIKFPSSARPAKSV